MESTTNQALVNFIIQRLSPKPSERQMISDQYERLQKILGTNVFQNGSYARHTSTTPVNDLDVFYVLPPQVLKVLAERRIDPDQLDITDILNTLGEQLRLSYGNDATIKVQHHSVGIFFGAESDFSIDVVPAQPLPDGKYLVPEAALMSVSHRREFYKKLTAIRWIKSDPNGYTTQATSLDDTTNGTFRKVAKFVKKWRVGCKSADESFPLKSFHVEIAVTELLKRNTSLNCLEAVHAVLSQVATLIVRPQYPDKADATRYVDQYVATFTDEDRNRVIAEQERLKPLLTQLQGATTTTAVLKAVDSILRLAETKPVGAPVTATSPRKSEAYSKPYIA